MSARCPRRPISTNLRDTAWRDQFRLARKYDAERGTDRIEALIRVRELLGISNIEGDTKTAVLRNFGSHELLAIVDPGNRRFPGSQETGGPASASRNVENRLSRPRCQTLYAVIDGVSKCSLNRS